MTNPIVVPRREETRVMHYYWCEGCDSMHGVRIRQPGEAQGWTHTGTLESPTYDPSVMTTMTSRRGELICHTFIRAGMVQFLPDCTHSLAGTTRPMIPVPDWLAEEQ